MSKPFLAALVALSFSATAAAQRLFTYGNDTVSVAEFISAYNKNNTAAAKSPGAIQKYLDLYIASRLKIKEAKGLGYDTLPQLVSDLEGLRAQIIPAFLADEESIQKLVTEAAQRGQKDIHLAHVFIAAGSDTLAAKKRATEAYQKLASGTSFSEIAKAYSDDPSVKSNGGDIGYVTVFGLPYALENLLYGMPVGKPSPVYRSKAGYHILKNLGERKAAGRIKAAQILIAYPPDATKPVQDEAKRLADSLYNRLLKGDDFAKLATTYSNDVISAASGGVMPEFGVGQYEPQFESAVYALSKAGTITKPFQTSHGWHIVKFISRVPVTQDAAAQKSLREKVEASDRLQWLQQAQAQKVLQQAGFTVLPFKQNELWMYSDSVFNYRTGKNYDLNSNTALLRIGDKNFTAQDWITYARTAVYNNNGGGTKPYAEVWESFVPYAALEYYKSNLEAFNPSFRAQLEEFRDGNLFFEIMQQKVWGPSQADTVALLGYYNNHKSRYLWGPSAAAVIFYASDAAKAAAFRKELMAKPAAWKSLLANYTDNISADSSRFEWAQIPNGGAQPKKGVITSPVVNKADGTASFAYIIDVYSKGAQRSFAEAKGLVIADYQAQLEKEWVNELKKKYPVTVNIAALKGLSK